MQINTSKEDKRKEKKTLVEDFTKDKKRDKEVEQVMVADVHSFENETENRVVVVDLAVCDERDRRRGVAGRGRRRVGGEVERLVGRARVGVDDREALVAERPATSLPMSPPPCDHRPASS